ncbi:MAG: hypothetical protein HC830_15260 [Bacteroidetes bacterium]|nr:hypothetical protein [Bacteroidota bacterium]
MQNLENRPETEIVQQQPTSLQNTEILITNSVGESKAKSRGFRIRFGGEREQVNSGNLAITTKY